MRRFLLIALAVYTVINLVVSFYVLSEYRDLPEFDELSGAKIAELLTATTVNLMAVLPLKLAGVEQRELAELLIGGNGFGSLLASVFGAYLGGNAIKVMQWGLRVGMGHREAEGFAVTGVRWLPLNDHRARRRVYGLNLGIAALALLTTFALVSASLQSTASYEAHAVIGFLLGWFFPVPATLLFWGVLLLGLDIDITQSLKQKKSHTTLPKHGRSPPHSEGPSLLEVGGPKPVAHQSRGRSTNPSAARPDATPRSLTEDRSRSRYGDSDPFDR